MTELNELFADVASDIQRAILDLGWHTPTPVQAAAIPKMRVGNDLIVQAMTGSGKTGAFGIPLVEQIDTELKETQAIVLLPTRELANQVAIELDQLGQYRGVNTLPIYGGVAYGPQLEGLERGAHIVVGTPGRILDHLKNGRMDLSHTKVLVLDEADEMLSLGFWPDMKEVASFLPRKRQSHLFSATMPEKVRSLSRFFLTDAEDVTIENEHGSPQKISHYFYMVTAAQKEASLARILDYEDPESAIIFCNTKADVRYVTGFLKKRGHNADQISGDLAQAAREKAIAKIKNGKLRFLVATDVAARGIDISDLAYVVNYTTSDSPEVYVHRTGRTGRAGKSGVAISLVSGLDIGNFKYMQTVAKIKVTEKKVPSERDIDRRKKGKDPKPKLADVAAAEPDADWKALQAKATDTLQGSEAADIDAQAARLLPFIKEAAKSEKGLNELARISTALLFGEIAEGEEESGSSARAEKPAAAEVVPEARTESESAGEPATRRRSRRGGNKPAPTAEKKPEKAAPKYETLSESDVDDAPAKSEARSTDAEEASESRPKRARRSRTKPAAEAETAEEPKAEAAEAEADAPRPRRRRRTRGGDRDESPSEEKRESRSRSETKTKTKSESESKPEARSESRASEDKPARPARSRDDRPKRGGSSGRRGGSDRPSGGSSGGGGGGGGGGNASAPGRRRSRTGGN
ncbi:MAG: DEAD/DEAH box helicase [Myxococcota bacterium]